MSKFKFFVRETNFLELPKYSWNLQMLTIIEKLKNIFFWNIVEKLAPFLARWQVGMFIGTLARKNEMLARILHIGT